MSIERLNPQCIQCLINKHLRNIPDRFSSAEKTKYMQGILEIIAKADISMSAPEIVGQINEFKQHYGEVNDFAEIKSYFNNLMLSYEKKH